MKERRGAERDKARGLGGVHFMKGLLNVTAFIVVILQDVHVGSDTIQ